MNKIKTALKVFKAVNFKHFKHFIFINLFFVCLFLVGSFFLNEFDLSYFLAYQLCVSGVISSIFILSNQDDYSISLSFLFLIEAFILTIIYVIYFD